jgi:hypothetical protein
MPCRFSQSGFPLNLNFSETTLRLTANEFAAPPAAIDCDKPLYDMHLSSQLHSTDCYPLGSITIDFEGAWAQKWAQRNGVNPSVETLRNWHSCRLLNFPTHTASSSPELCSAGEAEAGSGGDQPAKE